MLCIFFSWVIYHYDKFNFFFPLQNIIFIKNHAYFLNLLFINLSQSNS